METVKPIMEESWLEVLRPDFESDLEGATLEESIGTNTAFQLDLVVV